MECAGEALWFDPTVTARTTRERTAYLLSTFDEIALDATRASASRARNPDIDRTRLISEAGGGIVVVGGRDIGTFKRKVDADAGDGHGPGRSRPHPRRASKVWRDAAQFLADFHERPLNRTYG